MYLLPEHIRFCQAVRIVAINFIFTPEPFARVAMNIVKTRVKVVEKMDNIQDEKLLVKHSLNVLSAVSLL